ncbi:MAG TPA: CDP-archaeol synthase [Dokdonella sp.]|nr:CDP-archaeol synthase [Dokdonella sp.]
MRDSFAHLLELVYFMAPAYGANMAPPLVKFWRGWNRPIHEPWFGAHKTVLGFCVGVAAAVAAAFAQRVIDSPLSRVDYADWPVLGLAFGLGAMVGDTAKSFCKRRLGMAPGTRWIPIDQLDFAIGALVATRAWVRLDAADIALVLATTFVGDVVVNRAAFRLGMKDTPW